MGCGLVEQEGRAVEAAAVNSMRSLALFRRNHFWERYAHVREHGLPLRKDCFSNSHNCGKFVGTAMLPRWSRRKPHVSYRRITARASKQLTWGYGKSAGIAVSDRAWHAGRKALSLAGLPRRGAGLPGGEGDLAANASPVARAG